MFMSNARIIIQKSISDFFFFFLMKYESGSDYGPLIVIARLIQLDDMISVKKKISFDD